TPGKRQGEIQEPWKGDSYLARRSLSPFQGSCFFLALSRGCAWPSAGASPLATSGRPCRGYEAAHLAAPNPAPLKRNKGRSPYRGVTAGVRRRGRRGSTGCRSRASSTESSAAPSG